MHFSAEALPADARWQPHWWTAWITPVPTWLERLERDTFGPRLLRR